MLIITPRVVRSADGLDCIKFGTSPRLTSARKTFPGGFKAAIKVTFRAPAPCPFSERDNGPQRAEN